MLNLKMARFSKLVRLIIACSLVTGVLLTGCRGPQDPDPSMTAVRSGMGDGDFVTGSGVDTLGGMDGLDGLEGRDPSMMMGEGNRIENLFSPVYFDFDQSFVRPADRGTLQEVASHMSSNQSDKLLVEGHCDWRGTTEYNMALGDRRATSVVAYLQQLGVSRDRMETVSKGDLEAVTEGDEQQMSLDRRADLIIVR